jgi:hypothetical protein
VAHMGRCPGAPPGSLDPTKFKGFKTREEIGEY